MQSFSEVSPSCRWGSFKGSTGVFLQRKRLPSESVQEKHTLSSSHAERRLSTPILLAGPRTTPDSLHSPDLRPSMRVSLSTVLGTRRTHIQTLEPLQTKRAAAAWTHFPGPWTFIALTCAQKHPCAKAKPRRPGAVVRGVAASILRPIS